MSAADTPLSLMVATPTYGGIEPAFVESILHLQEHLRRLGVAYHFRFLPGESHINRARNRLVYEFLETKFTHLLFLDADIAFHPDTAVRLLTSGRDVVGVPYPKKGVGQGLVGNPERHNVRAGDDGKAHGEVRIEDGFVRSSDAGTGFLLIARTVFETLKPKMVPYTCDLTAGAPKMFPFFDSGPEDAKSPDARYLTEDFWFCRLWQAAGDGEVWLDTKSRVKHVGKYAFEAKSWDEEWGLK